MIKFDNKLELRYYFSDKSNYMDAMIKHRSEKEVLSLVRTLADMLDIKMTVYCESFAQQEGFREIWSVAGENSRLISVLLNLFMQVWARPSLLVGGQPAQDRSAADEEKMQREIALLRTNLRKKIRLANRYARIGGVAERLASRLQMQVEFLRSCARLSEGDEVHLARTERNNRSRSGSLEVKREQFDYYILRSDELPSVKDNKATIEIISPVLKDARYRWKGIYNKGGETIDFYMCDEDFKKDMFDEKIVFKSGMCIDCVLEIQRKMSELGEVVNISYTVETVIRTRFDKMEIVTPQGKRHLRKLEAEKKQLTLDLFG